MVTNESNTHADPLLGSRWAQMWVHMWAETMVRILVYVTKGNIKNIFEVEGTINLRESCFNFLNRPIPFFPKEQVILKLREQWFIKIEAPFVDEILD